MHSCELLKLVPGNEFQGNSKGVVGTSVLVIT
jgi:hypothetical protein